MKINNFVLSNHCKSEKFEYGMKLIPKKSLNRSTDNLIVSTAEDITSQDKYNVCFTKKISHNLVLNSYKLSKQRFEEYILFLKEFNDKQINRKNNMESKFYMENEGTIIINVLSKEYIKVSSIKKCNNSFTKIFFILLKEELLIYISVLKKILYNKKTDIYLNFKMDYLVEPISKKEKDELYLAALYIFADSILDNRNRNDFNLLAKEINRILEV